jgi:hypothetical protein
MIRANVWAQVLSAAMVRGEGEVGAAQTAEAALSLFDKRFPEAKRMDEITLEAQEASLKVIKTTIKLHKQMEEDLEG